MGGMREVILTIMRLEWLTTYICKPPEDRPWDALGWKGIIDEGYPSEVWNGWKRVQCQELNHSRLAMVVVTGLVAQRTSSAATTSQVSASSATGRGVHPAHRLFCLAEPPSHRRLRGQCTLLGQRTSSPR
ncbi:FCPF [Symbiodinium sp. CCMP2592]|nr:FCPF [Symbiodinium sp. CCMP2592]